MNDIVRSTAATGARRDAGAPEMDRTSAVASRCSPRRVVGPGISRARPRDPGNAGVSRSRGLPLDHLRPRRHRPRAGLFRAHRHHRLRPGQVPADRPGQGDRAGRDRPGRRRPRRQRRAGEGGRRSGRARPFGRRGRREGGQRRPEIRRGRKPASTRSARRRARPCVLAAPGHRVATRHGRRTCARAKRACCRRTSANLPRRSLPSTPRRRRSPPSAICWGAPSRPRRT